MFGKNKVSQSMIDAVNKVLGEQPVEQNDVLLNEAGAPIKEPTSTGMKVYGRSYGNSAKAKQDQTKSSVDDLKGPKTKELLQKDKEEHEKTKGKYDEAAKPDFLDMDKDGDKKEPMKKAVADKKKMAEELKGDQHKIDANKNNKIDAHDFAILRGKKKVKEDMYFAKKLIEGMKRSDIPASVRKARGDAPLTPAEVKSGSKDSISDPKNLAKARNEEAEELDEASEQARDNKIKAKVYAAKLGSKFRRDNKIRKLGLGSNVDTAIGRKLMRGDPHDSVKAYASEEVEQIDEKNEPTNPSLWSRAKALARSKFDVYPSAYANGWASKWYKSKGGSWRSVSEATEPPFDKPYTTIKKVVTDKSGAKHSPMSRARDIARMAMKKQMEKMKPVKESLEESRKAEIVKEIMKKKKDKSEDAFQKDPELTTTLTKVI